MTEARRGRGSGFGPAVVAGVLTAALAAVASARGWYAAATDRAVPGVPDDQLSIDMPLALALALVLLASWGAYLVSRERGRRIVATLALLADVGLLATVAWAPTSLPGQLRDRLDQGLGTGAVDVAPTGWFWAAAIAGVLALWPLLQAWRRAPVWPTMSSRYDAPAATVDKDGPVSDMDLWKLLDEGHDPTLGPSDER